ncbi:MAG: TRAP transporter substrate-binding protein [Rhodocyclales bacterium]|nr:TRAP transporter substrate-binding protein [Rhodocyclales bacterium]
MQLRKTFSPLVAATIFAFGAGSSWAQEVTLKVHHFLSPNATSQKLLLGPWCEKIAKESNNRLKCQIYPAMQLGGTPPQLFDQAKDGVADIIWTVPTYQAGRFIKSEVFELPFMTKTAEGSSRAFWEYMQRNSLDEFKGTKILMAHVHDGAELHFASKQVKVLEDLKGLKVRAPTRIGTRMLTALGATPIQMPAPQAQEAISKGVVDGASLPWEVVPGLKVNEVTKTSTETGPGQRKMSNTIFVVAMNEAKYNSLPADLRKVIDANSGAEASAWAGKVWDSTIVPGRKSATDRGNIVNVLSPAEYQRWEKATENVAQDWIKDVTAKGGDGNKLLDSAKALLNQYDR